MTLGSETQNGRKVYVLKLTQEQYDAMIEGAPIQKESGDADGDFVITATFTRPNGIQDIPASILQVIREEKVRLLVSRHEKYGHYATHLSLEGLSYSVKRILDAEEALGKKSLFGPAWHVSRNTDYPFQTRLWVERLAKQYPDLNIEYCECQPLFDTTTPAAMDTARMDTISK